MNGDFTTIFEVSYFSNWVLLKIAIFLAMGLFLIVVVIRGREHGRRMKLYERFFIALCVLVWNTVTIIWLLGIILEGAEYTDALKSGKCEVVAGTVHVLHTQPWTGHDKGDHIRIADKEFIFSYFTSTLAYRRTVSHGGKLKEGVYARVHYYDDKILKVEIKKKA